jgi:hypothetical protein
MKNIIGIRYQCANCPNYNLCQFDYEQQIKNQHQYDHAFIKIRSLCSIVNEIFYELELDPAWFRSINEPDSLASSRDNSDQTTVHASSASDYSPKDGTVPLSPSSDASNSTYPPENNPMKLTRGYSELFSKQKQIQSVSKSLSLTENKKLPLSSTISHNGTNHEKNIDDASPNASSSHSRPTKTSPKSSPLYLTTLAQTPPKNVPNDFTNFSNDTDPKTEYYEISASHTSSLIDKESDSKIRENVEIMKKQNRFLPHEINLAAYTQTNDLFEETIDAANEKAKTSEKELYFLEKSAIKAHSYQTEASQANYVLQIPNANADNNENEDEEEVDRQSFINYRKDNFGAVACSPLYANYAHYISSSAIYSAPSNSEKPKYVSDVEKKENETKDENSEPLSTSPNEDDPKDSKEPLLTTDLVLNSGPVRNWSEIAAQFLEEKDQAVTTSELYHILVKYQQLALDFKAAASTIAKTIIDEAYLPIEKKTIKPIDAGGVAGGQKFLHDGIFLKFAIDLYGVYGGDVGASKAASRELQGLKAYFQARIQGLFVPFMVVIDYRGFRMSAMPCLPIGKGTLKYGSNDGGLTIIKEDKLLNRIMKMAAQEIGLKGHLAGIRSPNKIYGPADIEGHRGTDGRYYVIDTARVLPPFPPETTVTAFIIPKDPPTDQLWVDLPPIQIIDLPLKRWRNHVRKYFSDVSSTTDLEENIFSGISVFSVPGKLQKNPILNRRATAIVHREIYGDALLVPTFRMKGMHLINLLRYEYVQKCKQNNILLSSDAFTFFQVPGPERDRDEETIREVTKKLINEEIPAFCNELLRGELQVTNSSSLVNSMHQRGINLKFLGLVRSYVKENSDLDALVLSEMVARTTKGFLRSTLRKVKPAELDNACKVAVVSYFNLVLGENYAAKYYWTTLVKPLIITKFGKCLTNEEMDAHYDLRRIVRDKLGLLTTLSQQVGVEFPEEQIEALRRDPMKFQTKRPIDVSKASQIRLVAHARSWGDNCLRDGIAYLKQAMEAGFVGRPPPLWKCPHVKRVDLKQTK